MSGTPATAHDRLDFERVIACSRAVLWQSLIDPELRQAWGPSEGEVLRFTATDTREGGHDVHLCGPETDPGFEVTTIWHRIAEPDAACFTEVMRAQGRLLSASQVDYALTETEAGCRLAVTVWVSSFVGPDLVAGFRTGWSSALDNLTAYLEKLS
ncbi:MAG: SRPBCC domain-containing protein [Paracoccaceae bacterium]